MYSPKGMRRRTQRKSGENADPDMAGTGDGVFEEGRRGFSPAGVVARVSNNRKIIEKNGKPMCRIDIAIDSGKLYNWEWTAMKPLFFPIRIFKKVTMPKNL